MVLLCYFFFFFFFFSSCLPKAEGRGEKIKSEPSVDELPMWSSISLSVIAPREMRL